MKFRDMDSGRQSTPTKSSMGTTDMHVLSAQHKVDYRRSGFSIAALLVLAYAVLVLKGQQHSFLLLAAMASALGSWFEIWVVRKAVDALIGAGNFLHRFTNPLLFGLIYVLAVVPTAAVLKIVGKDPLDLRFDRERKSYWKMRPNGAGWKGGFRNQF